MSVAEQVHGAVYLHALHEGEEWRLGSSPDALLSVHEDGMVHDLIVKKYGHPGWYKLQWKPRVRVPVGYKHEAAK